MSSLPRYLSWLDLVEDLVARPTPAFPRDRLVGHLVETFDTQVSWNWHEGTSFGFELSHPIEGWPSPAEVEVWADIGMSAHPLICWFATTGDPRPMTIGRVPAGVAPANGAALI